MSVSHSEYIMTIRSKRMTGQVQKLTQGVYSVCFFRSDFEFCNSFFLQNNITRLQGDELSLYKVSNQCVETLLTRWAHSNDRKNRLTNRSSPLPNANGFCWPNKEINRLIYSNRYIIFVLIGFCSYWNRSLHILRYFSYIGR